MSIVLIIEDQFLVSYDLECAFKERGHKVRHAATAQDALAQYRALRERDELIAVVCDNRLIDNKPVAKSLYSAIRNNDAETPFIVYSA
jgi:DNA-binding NtrC family response regulator